MKYLRIIFSLTLLIHISTAFAQIEKPKPTVNKPKPTTTTPSNSKPVTSKTESSKSYVISTEGWTPFAFQMKWGYKDKTGKVVLEPTLDYDYCYPFSNGLARVYNNGNFYFINEKGEKYFDKIFCNAYDFSNGLAPVRDLALGKWHYINKNGEIAFYEEYDMAYEFIDGIAIVQINNKYSYINSKGENIFKRQFDFARPFQNGVAIVQEHEGETYTISYIDIMGKNIFWEKTFKRAFPFYGNYAQVSDSDNFNACYLIDRNLQRKDISFKMYSSINGETNEEIMTYGNYFRGYDPITKKYCFLNQYYEQTDVRYDMISILGKKGNFKCKLESGKWIILDKDLNRIGEEYLYVGYGMDNGLTPIQSTDSLYRFVDEKGSIAREISSLSRPSYGDGYYVIEPAKGSLWFINTLGEKKMGPYKWAGAFMNGPLAPVQDATEQYFYIDKEGKAKNGRYKYISFFNNGPAMVGNDGKFWYVNIKEENVFNKTFEDAGRFNEYGYATAKENGKWGCINKDGKTIIPFVYDNCNPIRNHELTEVQLNGKWGYANKKGELVISCIYEDEDWFGWEGRKYARVKYNGKWGCINDTGKVLVDYNYSNKKDVPVPE